MERSSTRDVILAALALDLVDQDRNPVYVKLLPGLTQQELEEFSKSLSAPLSEDYRDLLQFCSGMEGTLDQIDFTSRSLDAIGLDFLGPHIPIAHDGCGNFWIVELQSGIPINGPIYFCCHDAPVFLLQALTIQQFVSEVFKTYIPQHKSLVDDVYEDRLFDVWHKNPGVVDQANALASSDPDIQSFASTLDPSFELIDLRNAPIGMGFSWGRYGSRTEVRRHGTLPIFAYRKPERTGIFSRWFGS